MAAGRLRDRVTFQREIAMPDGGGGSTLVWQPILTVWGEVRVERGRERVAAGRLESETAAVLVVRSSTQSRAITANDRAVIRDAAYQVRSNENPDRRRKFQELTIERAAT